MPGVVGVPVTAPVARRSSPGARSAGDAPGAGQIDGSVVVYAAQAARYRRTGGEHAGGRGLSDAQVGLGGVHSLRDRDGGDGFRRAECDRIGLDRVEDAEGDARRLPGGNGDREVFEVRVLRSGFRSSPVATNLGLGIFARRTVCDCFNSEQPSAAGVW